MPAVISEVVSPRHAATALELGPRLSVALLAVLAASGAACASDDGAATPRQHEITAAGELLTEDGLLREPGWSREQLLRWDPARVADPARLRQWDFFTIASADVAVNLTLTDLGFVRAATVGVVDLASGEVQQTTMLIGGDDAFVLSTAAFATASLTLRDQATPAMAFVGDGRGSTLVTIDLAAPTFGPAVRGTFTVTRRDGMPYLSVATPFAEDPQLFFYEQKIPGLSAEGELTVGGRTWTLAADTASAVMDWGRGAWPETATWRWAAASGTIDGAPIAFNLGEGFGDPTAATENLVVHDDIAHKLGSLVWTFDPDDPMADWRFDAPDGRARLTLHPEAPEEGGLDLGPRMRSRLRKAYGTFSGTLVLDDGRTVTLDGVRGFAEQMELAW